MGWRAGGASRTSLERGGLLGRTLAYRLVDSPARRGTQSVAHDVAQYAPFIHAVFKGLLPYRIVDRSQREESPVLVSLQGLLRLPSMRLSAAEVMDFLEVPTIARRLDLSDADLSRLADWIRDAGIRWGADGKAKSRWSLPEDGHNTWHFGLRRLLLGYAMGDGNDLFAGSLPHNIPTAESELLGKLADFVDLLIHHQSSLREPRTALEWQATVSEILDCFYAPEPLEELELDIVIDIDLDLDSDFSCFYFSFHSYKHIYKIVDIIK